MVAPTPYALPPVEQVERDAQRLTKQAREVTAKRDAALLRMSDAGFGVRAIAARTGLPQATVARIIRKQREADDT